MSLLTAHRSQSSQSEAAADSQAYVRDLLQSADARQAQREALVDARQVLFASAASADHRPRMAATEAFDLAAAALPRPPNWCHVTISVDYAAMLDTPQVIWHNLCKANSVSATDAKTNTTLNMIGGVVCQQHPGGGYLQVMLGCIPDLQIDAFTFDLIPERVELCDPTRPPPALCLAMLDARLSLLYERALAQRVSLLAQRLPRECALVGGIYPSIRAPVSTEATAADDEKEATGKDVRRGGILDDSIFFVNDRIYRGSAGVVVMRSHLLRAHSVSVVPSISVGRATLDGTLRVQSDGRVTVPRLSGQRASDVIKQTYCSSLLSEKSACKVFLGVSRKRTDTAPPAGVVLHDKECSQSGAKVGTTTTAAATTQDVSSDAHGAPTKAILENGCVVPVAFVGDPESGELHCTPPPGVTMRSGDTVQLLVEDAELDSEAAAGLLIDLEKRVEPVSVSKDITVAREARRHVVTSSAAGLHFSQPGLNAVAQPSAYTIRLDNTSAMFTPSVLQRCLGRSCATAGMYCPGQIAQVGESVTGIFPRSSTYCVLQGLS